MFASRTEFLQEVLDDARFERMLATRAMSAAKDTGDEVQIDMAGRTVCEADRNVRLATRALDLHMGIRPRR